MAILIYQQSRFALPYEEEFAKKLPGRKHFRNARLFDGQVETDAELVYTNDMNVLAAYRAVGVQVEPIPTGQRAPRFKVDPEEVNEEKPKRSRTAKPKAEPKTTTRRTTKASK